MYFSISALADHLMLATIGYANAKIDHPSQVSDFFYGAYAPASIPQLRKCRDIQRHLRSSLTDESTTKKFTPVVAAPDALVKNSYEGLSDKSPESGHIVAEFIQTVVQGTRLPREIASHGYSMEFAYRFVSAKLGELVDIAVAFLLQDDLRKKVGICAREGCGNIFIDLYSRGNRRMYCKTDECEKLLNQERVAKSRRTIK